MDKAANKKEQEWLQRRQEEDARRRREEIERENRRAQEAQAKLQKEKEAKKLRCVTPDCPYKRHSDPMWGAGGKCCQTCGDSPGFWGSLGKSFGLSHGIQCEQIVV